ncbi:MAG: LURP-one-related family protein [Clostridia bacterium]|nr:LURP-one-related family protein [Clostridia bacterium]
MRFYLKQRVFSWGDKFTVYDENGGDAYYVEGEVFSWGKKLHLCDLSGNELAFVRQKVFSFLPKYEILRDNVPFAEVVKEFTFFRQEYSIAGLGWRVHGDFFDHEYEITSGSKTIVSVSKQWFTFGDAYEIYVDPAIDPVTALSVVLVIDACIEAQNNG